jgi:putative toxin-antitoxin system antitoxin component (TIGR02293 family)
MKLGAKSSKRKPATPAKPAAKKAAAAQVAVRNPSAGTGKRYFKAYAKPKPAAARSGRPTMYVRMGELVGQTIHSETDVLGVVRKGLPASAVFGFAREFTLDPELVAPASTLRRRAGKNEALTVEESERMMRIARVTSLAEALYDDEVRAKQWLGKPGAFVPGEAPISPLALAATEAGARIVESVIQRVAYGML